MKKTLKILNQIAVDVEILDNPYNFQIKDLFLFAARNNKKRAFLFVSKLLGKHIPVDPKRALLTGKLLGFLINEKVENREENRGRGYKTELIAKALSEDKYIHKAFNYAEDNLMEMNIPTLFIGFAETATALGNSVFSQFKGDNIYYIHTTRDEIHEYTSVFNFEEEHSHATSHFCYPLKNDILSEYKRIVLVDDEITTGKTALNLIRAINNKFKNKEYVVVSILDWRRKEHVEEYKKLENELGVVIKEVSLLDGEAICDSPSIDGLEIFYENEKIKEEYKLRTLAKNHKFSFGKSRNLTRKLTTGESVTHKYIDLTGRFGITEKDLTEIDSYACDVVKQLGVLDKKLIVLGTEEFMYIPMLIASKIEGAKYQSTTRSPIYASSSEEYGVKHAARFKSPFDKGVTNYIYNVGSGMYNEVLFITEREIGEESKEELIKLFYSLGIFKINFIYF
ncbi:phosphoribosyl transferase domain protein [Clostridium homopropionicum DSM 5847]|uniref:Phosphoribosyl transferase domain protein n=1 Tax=Clostridium homopropionicum DSM 5847 TaxID=1121318 RepID=A0A0L6Z7H8_9CLOT|nr:phosphoribosyltransferase family protein [Clostridium homopropionicum]KOA18919.1 phosphoribosyl transferase domain protein [Clostridium homopropionicum DSM 5847]SFG44541.1 TRSP domain C terminus to PRTase_2 [Clostridium homopropionicum]